MATYALYRLRPRGAFHLAERGVGIEETAEVVRSDTLFSALCSALRLGWGQVELERFLEPFLAGQPPLRLSSCFPFAGDVLFFPRPLLPLPTEPFPDVGKRLRQTRFVSLELFRRWLAGAPLSDAFAPECFLGEVSAWSSPQELGRLPDAGRTGAPVLWRRDTVPRVAIDRATAASQVYRAGRLAFGRGCGLAFLVDWRDQVWRPRFEQALRLLGDTGLGGLRSTGHGQFEPQPPQAVELPDIDGAAVAVTLSLYSPTEAELQRGALGPRARYELVSRGGWIASPDGSSYRRREVRMLAEGSVVEAAAAPSGRLVDVTPEILRAHRVYRYGFAFLVPARLPA